VPQRERLRHQFADDDGDEYQRNRHGGDRQHGCRPLAKAEPLLQKWAHELLSACTANCSREQAHEGDPDLDSRQRPFGGLAQTQEVPHADIRGGSVRPDVRFGRGDEPDLERRQRGIARNAGNDDQDG